MVGQGQQTKLWSQAAASLTYKRLEISDGQSYEHIMSNFGTRRPAVTFIVRLWSEHAANEATQWRGQVEHIQSSRKQYFRELDKLVAFINGCLEEKGKGAVARDD